MYKHIIKGLGDRTSLKQCKNHSSTVLVRYTIPLKTSHLLLQIVLFMASREFVVLSLDGSRALADGLGDDCAATNLSSLDHYKARPNTPPSEDNTTERDATTTELDRNRTYVQEWMLLCQRLPELGENSDISDEEVDWLEAGRHVANLEDSCSFITRQKESGSQLLGEMIKVLHV